MRAKSEAARQGSQDEGDKNVSFAFLFGSWPPRAVNRGSGSIANPDVAHDAFAVRRDHDASLDIAVGSVAVRGRRDDDPAAVIAVVMVVVMTMGVERMVMMVVVVVIELRELQRLRLLCPGQIIRDESLEGIRNRLQQVGKGLSRGGGRSGRRCIGGVEGQKAGSAA